MDNELKRLLEDADKAPLAHLLPRVVRFAQRTENSELAQWARLESLGYVPENPAMSAAVTIPNYRSVPGRWLDEYQRPLLVPRSDVANVINKTMLRQPVGELEELVQANGVLAMPDPKAAAALREHLQVDVTVFSFQPFSVRQVLAGIRAQLQHRLVAASAGQHSVDAATETGQSGVTSEIVELRPNFFGLGVNLRALWQWGRVRFRKR